MLITIDSSISELHGVLEPCFAVQYLESQNISKETLKNSDALIIRSTRKYGAETLSGTNVKFIGTVTSGYEHIDTEFCEKNGIAWVNAHGSNAESVGEYVAAALEHISKKTNRPLNELTLGIVGVGATGGSVKRNAEKFGMKLLLCDPPKNLNDNVFNADIITLHVPLDKSTHHLANHAFFAKMKQGAWFINAARGAVCNSEALREALKSGHLGGAIIDVWENEPNIDASLLPFIDIATPHIAGHSAEAKINAANMIANSVCKYFGVDSGATNFSPLHCNNTLHINKTPYNIHADDAIFRKNPEKFTEIRNKYKRKAELTAK